MSVTIEKHYFTGNGRVPNSRLPLLIYRQVLRGPDKAIEDALRLNRWMPSWYSGEGMWPHHHFHSEAHEIIMVTAGTHKGKFGGHDGREATLHAGDVIVIPAGVGHMGRGISDDLKVTGGFPLSNGIVDFRYGLPDEYDDCARRAAEVPLESFDPFFGLGGPLAQIWADADRGVRRPEPEQYDPALMTYLAA